MSNNDAFESSAGDASSTSTADYKYAQIAVPTFEVDVSTTTAAASATNYTGNSFIRLGSFPVTVTGTAMSTESDAPTGFASSLTLAKIVGDVSSLATYATTEDDVSSSLDGDKLFESDPFKGSKLVGFADDTRIRDDEASDVLEVDGAVVTNSTTNRKAETKRLLTKGGWWDHAGGNRISTTEGDKIEIIQGNYKLVVLGRRAATDTGDTKVVDISGGYEHSKRYEYLESEGVWATFDESSETYATKKSSGKDVSYFTGKLRKTVIGKDPDDSSYLPGDNDPDVISHTWAKKIETYMGSADKPVPHIALQAFAHAMEDTRYCTGEHVTLRSAGGSVVATNLAAVNVTLSNLAVGNLMTVNAALTSLFVNAFAKTLDVRTGVVFAFNTTRTEICANSTTFKGGEQIVALKRDELTTLRTELNNYATRVALEVTNVGLKNNNLVADVISNSVSVNNIALVHSFI